MLRPFWRGLNLTRELRKQNITTVRRLSLVLCLDKERRRSNLVFFQSASNNLSSFWLRVLDTFISLNGVLLKWQLCIPHFVSELIKINFKNRLAYKSCKYISTYYRGNFANYIETQFYLLYKISIYNLFNKFHIIQIWIGITRISTNLIDYH